MTDQQKEPASPKAGINRTVTPEDYPNNPTLDHYHKWFHWLLTHHKAWQPTYYKQAKEMNLIKRGPTHGNGLRRKYQFGRLHQTVCDSQNEYGFAALHRCGAQQPAKQPHPHGTDQD